MLGIASSGVEMPNDMANKEFKRIVRSGARATGRSYAATLRHLQRGDALQ